MKEATAMKVERKWTTIYRRTTSSKKSMKVV